MKFQVLALCMLLTACAHQPTGLAKPVAMPPLPDELSTPAQKLPRLTDPTLGGISVQGAEDDQRYNAVAHQLNAIIRAWGCVKQALDDNIDPKGCFVASSPHSHH